MRDALWVVVRALESLPPAERVRAGAVLIDELREATQTVAMVRAGGAWKALQDMPAMEAAAAADTSVQGLHDLAEFWVNATGMRP